MKKIDLHIHTKKTVSDSDFTFSINRLQQYVNEMKIDAIAVTNHNMFDKEQFCEICNALSGIMVFPGIEINIGANAGHLLVISDRSDLDDFTRKCKQVEAKIQNPTDSITVAEFKEVFINLKDYLLIPHYDKNPHVEKSVIGALGDSIKTGEVSSTKKFIYCKKNDDISPVVFSDWRPADGGELPVKQTYIDMGNISLKSLKKALMDKTKIHLSDEEGHHLFQALPELKLSTGLSVIIGGRSSGKSYTLDKIYETHENIKYIKQFSLLEKEPEKAEAEFSRNIESEQSHFVQEYLRPFSLAVNEVAGIDAAKDEKKIEEYIKSLIKYATDAERADAFSKCKLFSETEFAAEDLNVLKELISAVEKLLDARKYKEIIEKNIEREKLIKLHTDLIHQYIIENVQIKKKMWVNELIDNIKSGLQSKTSATRIRKVDFYDVQMNRNRIKRFNQLVGLIETDSVIKEKNIEGFKIQVSKRKYKGAGELRSQSGKKTAFKEAFAKYGGDAYEYLLELKNTDVMEKDYYQFFAKIDYKILNQYGYPVSGGERAEFNLLREINDALQYEMLLIDEPESSFDNIFLKKKVNHLIKEIAEEMPVIIVTHNSTVGASIQPDYVVHTRREIVDGNAVFKTYTGFPSDHELISIDGKTIMNIDATMDCLEAGRDAYEERRREYEMLEN